MAALAEIGGVILPPVPAFYHRPKTIDNLVNHTVGRVLDRSSRSVYALYVNAQGVAGG